jgi:hypothetical protein
LQFPEHGFYQLEDRVLLFYHDPSDPNLLRLINGVTTTADVIRDNSLVEVVMSGMQQANLISLVSFCCVEAMKVSL